MKALRERLAERHEAGHALDAAALGLHRDTRLAFQNLEYRPAAVLAAVTDRDDPGVLLTHRPTTMRAHAGEIAFPGGKLDPGETPVEAALREAWEELGIDMDKVHVIGTSDHYFTGSGFEITPVIGMVPPDIELNPNPSEVAQWFEAPLDFVLDPANHQQHMIEFEGAMHPYWEINWEGHAIWGVTAGILVNLSRRLRWHD